MGSNQVNLKEYEEFVTKITGYEWLGWRVNLEVPWIVCGRMGVSRLGGWME